MGIGVVVAAGAALLGALISALFLPGREKAKGALTVATPVALVDDGNVALPAVDVLAAADPSPDKPSWSRP
jgi:hypothetical protein